MGNQRMSAAKDFEGVYLKANQTKKYINSANPEILKEIDCIRVISAIIREMYQPNLNLLDSSGYEYEDLVSICRVHALVFSGSNYLPRDDKKYFSYMYNFIKQRLLYLLILLKKNNKSSHLLNKHLSVDNYVYDIMKYPIEDPSATDSQILQIYEKIEEALAGVSILKQRGARPESSKIRKISYQIRKLVNRVEDRRTKTISRSKATQLKNELDMNIDKYRIKLAHYATCPFVDLEIQKMAIKYCKKYKISYF